MYLIKRIIFLIITIIFFTGCNNIPKGQELIEITKKDFIKYTPFVGELDSVDETDIRIPFSGNIIFLKEQGDYVKKGDLIVKLDTQELQVLINSQELDVRKKENEYEQFLLRKKYKKYFVKKDEKIKKIKIETEEKNVEKIKTEIDNFAILEQRMKIANQEKEIVYIKKRIKEYNNFSEQGFISKEELDSLKVKLERAELDMKTLNITLKKLEKGSDELEIIEAEKNLKKAESQYLISKKSLDMFDKQTELEGQQYLKNIDSSKEKLEYYKEMVEKSYIYAESDGIFVPAERRDINGLTVVAQGMMLYEGDKIGKIAKIDKMVIVLYLNEFDLKGIKKGNNVDFSLDSNPNIFFTAKIVEINNMAEFSEYDQLKIKRVKLKAEIIEKSPLFKIGMTVSGKIITSKIRDVICINTSYIKNGYVTLYNGKKRKVSTGESNYFESVVKDGLKTGEKILVRKNVEDIDLENRKIEKIQKREIRNTIDETGILEAVKKIELTALRRGKIINIDTEGKEVKKGDVVAKIDTSDLEKDLEKNEFDLEVKNGETRIFETNRDNDLFKIRQDIKTKKINLELKKLEYENAKNPPPKRKLKKLEIDFNIADLKFKQLENEFKINKELNEKGFISDDKLSELERNYFIKKTELEIKKIKYELEKKGSSFKVIEKARKDYEIAKIDLDIAENKEEISTDEYKLKLERNLIEIKDLKLTIERKKNIIEKMSLKAPVDGIIVYGNVWDNGQTRKIKENDEVHSGMTVCSVVKVDKFNIVGNVSETRYPELEKGQEIEFNIPKYPTEKYSAKLDSIGIFAKDVQGMSGKAFAVTGDIISESSKFQPQTSVAFSIILNKKEDVLSLSRECIYNDKKGNYVFLDNKEKKYIKTGIKNFEYVEILEGLKENQSVLGQRIEGKVE